MNFLYMATMVLLLSVPVIYVIGPIVKAMVRNHREKRTPEPISPSIELVLMVMDRHEDWIITEYRIHHPTGIGMWIANDKPSLTVTLDGGDKVRPEHSPRGGNFIIPTRREKNALWESYQRMISRSSADTSEQNLIALARRIEEFTNQKRKLNDVHEQVTSIRPPSGL